MTAAARVRLSGRDALVRLKDAALELGVSAKTIKKYCRCRHLQCHQLPSGHWRVYRSSLDAELSRTTQTGPNRNNPL